MDNNFKEDERIFRAVAKIHIKENGEISSTAFSDKKGLSVERGYYREPEKVIEHMHEYLQGSIVSWNVGECHDINAVVKYMPTSNIYHSELHGSEEVIKLSHSQCNQLVKLAKREYMENI